MNNVITLRTRESLCLDLDDAYTKIEKLNTKVFDLEDTISTIEDNAESEQRELDLFNKVQKLEIEILNWKQISSLAAQEIEELRNRRD